MAPAAARLWEVEDARPAAAPVAPQSVVEELGEEADSLVCPHTPEPFYAIGAFYANFGQVSDKEVVEMLREYWKGPANGAR